MTESVPSTKAPTIQELNGALLLPKPKTRRKPLRFDRKRRQRIEAAVDGLLHLLDEIDGDADFEPTTSETAWPGIASGALDECEDAGDEEPAIGWASGARQEGAQWDGRGAGGDDLEDEHDGREPSLGYIHDPRVIDAEEDDDNGIADTGGMQEQLQGEPSLGWTAGIRQEGRAFHGEGGSWAGGCSDLEQEHDGREPEPPEPNGDEGDFSEDADRLTFLPAQRVRTFALIEDRRSTIVCPHCGTKGKEPHWDACCGSPATFVGEARP